MDDEEERPGRFREFMDKVAKNKPDDGPGVRKARRWLTGIGWASIAMWWVYFRG